MCPFGIIGWTSLHKSIGVTTHKLLLLTTKSVNGPRARPQHLARHSLLPLPLRISSFPDTHSPQQVSNLRQRYSELNAARRPRNNNNRGRSGLTPEFCAQRYAHARPRLIVCDCMLTLAESRGVTQAFRVGHLLTLHQCISQKFQGLSASRREKGEEGK